MAEGRIILLSGPPGSGKSAAAERYVNLPEHEKSVYLHTDDFYAALRRGYIPPDRPGSDGQNRTVIEAFCAAAVRFCQGGYQTVVDGVVGPWMIAPWEAAARAGCEVHYILLRASREETLRRALHRDKLDAETNRALVETMWGQFQNLGAYERFALDTTRLTLDETVRAVREAVQSGRWLLGL